MANHSGEGKEVQKLDFDALLRVLEAKKAEIGREGEVLKEDDEMTF